LDDGHVILVPIGHFFETSETSHAVTLLTFLRGVGFEFLVYVSNPGELQISANDHFSFFHLTVHMHALSQSTINNLPLILR
jgi:hypothetical protein